MSGASAGVKKRFYCHPGYTFRPMNDIQSFSFHNLKVMKENQAWSACANVHQSSRICGHVTARHPPIRIMGLGVSTVGEKTKNLLPYLDFHQPAHSTWAHYSASRVPPDLNFAHQRRLVARKSAERPTLGLPSWRRDRKRFPDTIPTPTNVWIALAATTMLPSGCVEGGFDTY